MYLVFFGIFLFVFDVKWISVIVVDWELYGVKGFRDERLGCFNILVIKIFRGVI